MASTNNKKNALIHTPTWLILNIIMLNDRNQTKSMFLYDSVHMKFYKMQTKLR